jgi:pilus assembly protein CpaB
MADSKDLTAALHKAAEKKARHGALRATLFLVLALVAAVGSAVLLTRYMEARTAAARVPTVKVVVAAVHLPAGSEIRRENLQAIDWPVASRPEGTFEDPALLEGKVVSASVAKGEAILPSRLAGSDAGAGLAALLPPGMRAVAVRVDDVVGVAGFLHPGDSVDVIATLRGDGSQNQTSSKVILQNIKVLAVGKDLDHHGKASEKVVQATVATLMVDAEQSERLALAAAQGKILLTLRGGGDVELVATKGITPTVLLSGSEPGTPAPPARKRVARAPSRAEPGEAPKAEVVEILRGDLFERRDFAKREVTKEGRR